MTKNGKPSVTLMPRWLYIGLSLLAVVAALSLTFLIAFKKVDVNADNSFYILVIYALMVAMVFFGLTEIVADITGEVLGFKIKAGGTFAAFLIVLVFGFFSRTVVTDDKEFKVQLVAGPGLPQPPLINQSDAVTIVPLNAAEGVVLHVDGDGIARHVLPGAFFKDSVYVHINNPKFVVHNDHVKLDKNKRMLELILYAAKVPYHFTFEDADNPNIRLAGVHFICSELHIDVVTNASGVVDILADNTGTDQYNVSINCRDYTYKRDAVFDKSVTNNVFQLDKTR